MSCFPKRVFILERKESPPTGINKFLFCTKDFAENVVWGADDVYVLVENTGVGDGTIFWTVCGALNWSFAFLVFSSACWTWWSNPDLISCLSSCFFSLAPDLMIAAWAVSTEAVPPILISAQFLNTSCNPQPKQLVPFLSVPQLFPKIN